MQILDGKNHRHGAYDKIALDVILSYLNGGRHWGRLILPDFARKYTREEIIRTDAEFLKTLRALVDQWIDSGINEDGIETPSSRYVRGLPKGYSESLFDILHRWLGRNMPKTVLMNEGKIGILDQRPNLYGELELDAYAHESAIFYLKELLECPAPHRLGKCRNPKCRTYFIRKRARNGEIKRGTYCGKCQLIGASERTRLSRQRRKNQQLDAAAKVWRQWKKSNSYPNRSEWVAKQVNKQVRSGTPIQAKWVTQNKKTILDRRIP
jgi:hypothetical protein